MIKNFSLLLFVELAFWGCEEEPEDCAGVAGGDNICGCTDSKATNYDSTATFDDGNCNYEDIEPPSSIYRYPLDEYSIIQDFGNPSNDFNQKYHSAEDLYGTAGTPVYAVANGEISYSGTMGGYGWLITIDHPEDDVYSLYGHLSSKRDKVTEGEVQMGNIIAYIADDDEDGSGGEYPDWGPHLHFAIRQGSRYDYPENGDNRWMAGYTYVYPTEIGWLDPTDFIEGHSQ